MNTTPAQIDWDTVRQRLARCQVQPAESECVDRDRLNEVFRERARNLERRGRHETTKASRVSVVMFRLGNEHFGVPLMDLKQVFPHVPIAPIPGKPDLLIGVAHLDGVLRSVVDPNVVLQTSAKYSEDGYIVLLRAGEQSLALWVEMLDGVADIDLAALLAIDGVASDKAGNLVRGITDSRISILDTAAVVNHVKEQLTGRAR